jgi:hypothetical protein
MIIGGEKSAGKMEFEVDNLWVGWRREWKVI